jgi:hypothetical protein
VKPIYQKFQLLLNAQYNENLPDSWKHLAYIEGSEKPMKYWT